MSNLNQIPREFQVLSIQPELRIRYSIHVWDRIFPFLLLSPFIFLFIGHSLLLLYGLYEILHLRFWLGIQAFSYGKGSWSILMFFFTFSLLGFASWLLLWSLLGVTEIHADHDSLTVIYRLFGISRKVSIPAKDINYFNQFLKEDSENTTCDLEIVTSLRYAEEDQAFPAWFPTKWISEDMVIRINYKTIHLYANIISNPSEWLGSVLANFYKVRFQSISQSIDRY